VLKNSVEMQQHTSIVLTVFLFSPLFCATPIQAQQEPRAWEASATRAPAGSIAEENRPPCFEEPDGEGVVLNNLPANARFWLTEDVPYIITSGERCAFLHLAADEERFNFMEQFWYGRAANSQEPDNEFKVEHYRRIAFANQKFGGQLPGWATDRGRIYIIWGPPDSVEIHAASEVIAGPDGQGLETFPYPTEKWHYRYLGGMGENIDLRFVDSSGDANLRLTLTDARSADLLQPVTEGPLNSPHSSDAVASLSRIELYIGIAPSPRVQYEDLEAVVTSQIVRNQVDFTHRMEFAQATHATTLARIKIDAPTQQFRSAGGQPLPAAGYELLARISEPSEWEVDTFELIANEQWSDGGDLPSKLSSQVDAALPPGTYRLALVVKNLATGDVGVTRTSIDVPGFDALEKN
jgi:GWxTD domain-containing protein